MARIKVSEAIARARSAARRGDTEAARAICGTVLENFPGNRRARDMLAELRAPVSAGPPADAPGQDLVALFEAGDHDAVVRLAQERLAETPTSAPIWNIFGAALARSGRPDSAVEAFGEATRLAPDHSSAHMNLGNALLDLDRHDAAIAAYSKAIELRPGFAEAHYNLGRALQRAGDLAGAESAYRAALSHMPDHRDATTNLWGLLLAAERPAEAAQVLEQRLLAVPDDAEVRNNLGTTLKQQGRIAEAIAAFKQAVEVAPDNPEIRRNLGLTLRVAGDDRAAEDALRQAIDLHELLYLPFVLRWRLPQAELQEASRIVDAALHKVVHDRLHVSAHRLPHHRLECHLEKEPSFAMYDKVRVRSSLDSRNVTTGGPVLLYLDNVEKTHCLLLLYLVRVNDRKNLS
mgnify:CR=1 FL=1